MKTPKPLKTPPKWKRIDSPNVFGPTPMWRWVKKKDFDAEWDKKGEYFVAIITSGGSSQRGLTLWMGEFKKLPTGTGRRLEDLIMKGTGLKRNMRAWRAKHTRGVSDKAAQTLADHADNFMDNFETMG